MWRYMLVLALVIGPCAGLSRGQFLRIKIDWNEYKKIDDGKGAGGAGGLGDLPPGFGGPGGSPPPGGNFPGEGGEFYGETTKPKDIPPLWMEIWMPYGARTAFPPKEKKKKFAVITHHWGGRCLVPLKSIRWFSQNSIAKQYETKFGNIAAKDLTVGVLKNKAVWTLRFGMLAEYIRTMQQLAAKAKDDPLVKNFNLVYAGLKKKPARASVRARAILDNEEYGFSVYRRYVSKSGRFVLLTRTIRTTRAERLPKEKDAIDHRLEILERTYQRFYFWCGLKGIILPHPKHQLVVVVEKDPPSLAKRLKQFPSTTPMTDGFLHGRSNIMFLSAVPSDNRYGTLVENNRNRWTKYNSPFLSLLNLTESGLKRMKVTSWEGLAKLSTMALVQKAWTKNFARVTASYYGTRQLLAASEFLPNNITTAEWFRHGLASIFATSKYALFEHTGLPDPVALVRFKHYLKPGDANKFTAGNVLLKVVTDFYFHEAERLTGLPVDDEIRKKQLQDKARMQMNLAKSSSWALTYYLLKNDSSRQGLLNYYRELKKLPRDTEYDSKVLTGCFARAFGVVDKNANALDVNMTALRNLGANWFASIHYTQLLVAGVEDQLTTDLFPKKKPCPKLSRDREGAVRAVSETEPRP